MCTVSAVRMEREDGNWKREATPSTVHKFCGELQGTGIQCDVDGQDAGRLGDLQHALQLEVFFFFLFFAALRLA